MFKDMEYIYTVYLERSFSKAAKKLFISQPALSNAIKKAETELGCQLFDRTTNPISLTPEGIFYIDCAKQILDIRQTMDTYFEKRLQHKNQQIRIGSSTYCCTYVLPELIHQYRNLYPDVNVSISEAPSAELAQKLKNGDIDLILDAGSTGESDFNEIPFRKEHIILSVPSSFQVNHHLKELALPLFAVKSREYLDDEYPAVPLHHFCSEPFLFLKEGNDMYARGLAICKNSGFTPRISMYVDQMLTAYYLSCEGRGITFIRDSIVDHVEKTQRVTLYKINDPLASRHLTFSFKKQANIPPSALSFLSYIKNTTTLS